LRPNDMLIRLLSSQSRILGAPWKSSAAVR
jgi:hypothetical protein